MDPKCEFIPVDYPEAHDAKEALKKFLRVTAPSNPPSSGEASFVHLKVLDESGWLQQVKQSNFQAIFIVHGLMRVHFVFLG